MCIHFFQITFLTGLADESKRQEAFDGVPSQATLLSIANTFCYKWDRFEQIRLFIKVKKKLFWETIKSDYDLHFLTFLSHCAYSPVSTDPSKLCGQSQYVSWHSRNHSAGEVSYLSRLG